MIDFTFLTLTGSVLAVLFMGMHVYCWLNQYRYKSKLKKNTKKPFLSILVPAKDEEKTIARVVSDLKQQTNPFFEAFILANNCSDQTAERARQAAEGDPRIRVLEFKTDVKNKATALNEGLKRAKGSVIVAQDADTRIDPDFLAKIALCFQDKSVVAVQPRYEIDNKNHNLLTVFQEIEFLSFSQIFNKGKATRGESALAGGVSFAIRRKTLVKIGSWESHLTEDYHLVNKLITAGHKVTYADDAVVRFQGVTGWDDLLKQRSRWLKGHLDITARSVAQKPSSLFDTLFKLSPLYNSILFCMFLLFYSVFFLGSGQVTYYTLPKDFWIIGIVAYDFMLIDICRKNGFFLGVLLTPLYMVYTLHWMLVLFRLPSTNKWVGTTVQRY